MGYRGVEVNALDCSPERSGFEPQSLCYINFQTHKEKYELLCLSSYWLDSIITIFLWE